MSTYIILNTNIKYTIIQKRLVRFFFFYVFERSAHQGVIH